MPAYRTYSGLHGRPFRIHEHTIAATPAELRDGPCRYPFAAVAGKLDGARDYFASLALRSTTWAQAMQNRDVRRLVAMSERPVTSGAK